MQAAVGTVRAQRLAAGQAPAGRAPAGRAPAVDGHLQDGHLQDGATGTWGGHAGTVGIAGSEHSRKTASGT